MGDDDELNCLGELFERLGKPLNVATVEGSVNLVQDDKRRRFDR